MSPSVLNACGCHLGRREELESASRETQAMRTRSEVVRVLLSFDQTCRWLRLNYLDVLVLMFDKSRFQISTQPTSELRRSSISFDISIRIRAHQSYHSLNHSNLITSPPNPLHRPSAQRQPCSPSPSQHPTSHSPYPSPPASPHPATSSPLAHPSDRFATHSVHLRCEPSSPSARDARPDPTAARPPEEAEAVSRGVDASRMRV